MKYVLLLGRVLFSAIFIVKSIAHFFLGTIDHAVQMGVFLPSVLVPLSGIVGLLGGLSILFGYRARIGALMLILFLVPITVVMHRFWEAGDSYIVILEHFCFMKNISILGALCMIAYFGSGPLSLSRK